MAGIKDKLTGVVNKIRDTIYPKVSLKRPSEQWIIHNAKKYKTPDKPTDPFTYDYVDTKIKPEYQHEYPDSDRLRPLYTVTDIKQPADVYKEGYGPYQSAARTNLRSAMATRRRGWEDLFNKYPQFVLADRNVDQDILNSKFLPIADPAFGREQVDFLRDFYRRGGDYSKPVAFVKANEKPVAGVAHVASNTPRSKMPLRYRLLPRNEQLFPGIQESNFKFFGYGGPGAAISPTEDSQYGQTMVVPERAIVTEGIEQALYGNDEIWEALERPRYNSNKNAAKRLELGKNKVYNYVNKHEKSHLAAPYPAVATGMKPIYAGIDWRDLLPQKAKESLRRDRAEIDRGITSVLPDKTPNAIRRGAIRLSQDLSDSLFGARMLTVNPGYFRDHYFNLPSEMVGTFNTWKKNYARETGGLPAPRSLDELIQKEYERGAIKGPVENRSTVPEEMYSSGYTADWSSGINSALKIRNSVRKALREGKISKEKADEILRRMDILYRMSNNKKTVRGAQYA